VWFLPPVVHDVFLQVPPDVGNISVLCTESWQLVPFHLFRFRTASSSADDSFVFRNVCTLT